MKHSVKLSSIILFIVAVLVVISGFVVYVVDTILGVSYSFLLIHTLTILGICSIIVILSLIYYIGTRVELRKILNEIEKRAINIKIIFVAIIFILLILNFNYIYSIKPHDGLSITDISGKYNNQTISLEAWFDSNTWHQNNENYSSHRIYQYYYFGDSLGGYNTESISIRIYNDIDKSALIDGRKYVWTGVMTYESYIDEYNYNGEIKFIPRNIIYLNITKIETPYKDDDRHNISRFVGKWKEIKYDGQPVKNNISWIFCKNNTLQILTSSRINESLDGFEHFAVDESDKTLYYLESYLRGFLSENDVLIFSNFCKYNFSENNTKLTLKVYDHNGYLDYKIGKTLILSKIK